MADYQLGVIGAGNMAEAILRGVLAAKILPAEQIVASDISEDRRKAIGEATGIQCVADNATAAGYPRVVLAVKPQVMADVLSEVSPAVRADALVISIAAGIAAGFIDQRLGGKGRIVRVMPNTPMLVGAGVSAIAAGPRATEDDLAWTQELFSACGQTIRVEEAMMDAVTAVSGSGPAYFFYLIEAMVAAGVAEGLDKEVAQRLAVQTCRGASELMISQGENPDVLRARVTSPGGTTQAAIEAMDAAGVKDALVAAVRAAAGRSRELGK